MRSRPAMVTRDGSNNGVLAAVSGCANAAKQCRKPTCRQHRRGRHQQAVQYDASARRRADPYHHGNPLVGRPSTPWPWAPAPTERVSGGHAGGLPFWGSSRTTTQLGSQGRPRSRSKRSVSGRPFDRSGRQWVRAASGMVQLKPYAAVKTHASFPGERSTREDPACRIEGSA